MQPLTDDEFDRLYKPIAGPVDKLPDDVDVCIVGGGPVGLILANLMGHRGVRTLLLEREATTSDQPKAIAINCEFRRVLDWLGLSETSAEHLNGPVGINFHSPLGFVLAHVPPMMTPNGFPAMSTMSQPMFERMLLAGAQRYGCVSIVYGAPLSGFAERGDHLELMVGKPGEPSRVCRTRFLVGADGARSFVRKSLGIAFEGRKHDEQHLVLDLAAYPDQSPFLQVTCDPRRPRISIPAPYGGRRLEFMLKPGEDASTFADLDNVRRLIADYTPYRFDQIQIVRSLVYTFSERMAARFKSGRIFLIGDAAHLMPPFGGQGLNTGVRDALNLSWKLQGVVEGRLPPEILDTYEPERRDHIGETIGFSHWMGAATNCLSWPLCLMRDLGLWLARFVPPLRRYIAEMRYVPKPVYTKGFFLPERPATMGYMVGRLFPRIGLGDESGRQGHFDDFSGDGFTLVGIDVPPEAIKAAAVLPLWARLAPKLLLIKSDGVPTANLGVPTLNTLAERDAMMLQDHAGEILILRPDRHVAASAKPADFGTLTEKLDRLISVSVSAPTQPQEDGGPMGYLVWP